jgi:hypothetical protein
MHGLSLRMIRARVERLAAGVGCEDAHQRTNVSLWPIGEPRPAWPPADAATCCPCGAELEYIHIIYQQLPDVPVP